MKRLFLCIILFASALSFAQTKKDVTIYRGDKTTLTFPLRGDYSSLYSFRFVVKEDYTLTSQRKIYKVTGNGIVTTYNSTDAKSTVTILIKREDTQSLVPDFNSYVFDIEAVLLSDTTDVTTVYRGNLIVQQDVGTPYDGTTFVDDTTRNLILDPRQLDSGFVKIENGVITSEPLYSKEEIDNMMAQAGGIPDTNDYMLKQTVEDNYYNKSYIDGLTTADIDTSANRYYITWGQKTVLQNTSGTNTGDETASTIKSKLGISTLSGSNTGDQDLSALATKEALEDSTAKLRGEIPDVSGLLSSESDPVFLSSQAVNITSNDITKLSNTSGTNSGDETATSIKSKLEISTLSGSNTGDQDLSSYAQKINYYTKTQSDSIKALLATLVRVDSSHNANLARINTKASKDTLQYFYLKTSVNELLAAETDTSIFKDSTSAHRNRIVSLEGKTSNINNTSDLNKPISTATQTALNQKAGKDTLSNFSTKDSTYTKAQTYSKTETDTLVNGATKFTNDGMTPSKWDRTIVWDGMAGAGDCFLPAGAEGQTHCFLKRDTSNNSLTIWPDGSEKIGGLDYLEFTKKNVATTIKFSQGNWWITGSNREYNLTIGDIEIDFTGLADGAYFKYDSTSHKMIFGGTGTGADTLGGLPASDYLTWSDVDTDTLLAGDSDVKTVSQKAVKKYIDNAVASGVSDGDKGDIVFSNNGTTATIDSAVVTFAKIQTIPTNTILGRYNSGSGILQSMAMGDMFSLSGDTLKVNYNYLLNKPTLGSLAGMNSADTSFTLAKVISVNGKRGIVTLTTNDVDTSENKKFVSYAEKQFWNSRIGLSDLSSTATGLTYTAGVFSLTAGYVIPTTTQESNWSATKSRLDSVNIPLSRLNSITGTLGSNAFSSTAFVAQTTTVNGNSLSGNVTVSDVNLSVTDVTTNNASTTAHGFAPKLPGDSTKIYRGNGTWGTVASGNNASYYVVINSNFTTTSETPIEITGLTFTVEENKVYHLKISFRFVKGADNGSSTITLSSPADCYLSGVYTTWASSAVTSMSVFDYALGGNDDLAYTVDGITKICDADLVVKTTSAGAITLKYSKYGGSNAATVYKGTFMTLTEVTSQ